MSTLKERIVKKLQQGGSLPNVLLRSPLQTKSSTILYRAKNMWAPNPFPAVDTNAAASSSGRSGKSSGSSEEDMLMPSYMQAMEMLEGEVRNGVTKIEKSLEGDQKVRAMTQLTSTASRKAQYLRSENKILDKQLDKLGNSNDFNNIAGEIMSNNGQLLVRDNNTGEYKQVAFSRLRVGHNDNGTPVHYMMDNNKAISISPITADKAVNLAYHDYKFIQFMDKLDLPIVPSIRSTTSYNSVVDYISGLGSQGGIEISEDGTYAIIDGKKVSAESKGNGGFSDLTAKVWGLLNNDQKAKIDYQSKLQGSNITREEFLNNLVSFTFKLKNAKSTGAEDSGIQTTYSIAVGAGGNPSYTPVNFMPIKTGNTDEDKNRATKRVIIDVSSRPVHDIVGKMDEHGKYTSAVPLSKAGYLQKLSKESNIAQHILTFDGVDIAKEFKNSYKDMGVDIKDPVGEIIFLQGKKNERGDVEYSASVQQAIGLASKIFNSNYGRWVDEFKTKLISQEERRKKEGANELTTKQKESQLMTFLDKKVKDVIINGDSILDAVKKYSSNEKAAEVETKMIKSILTDGGIITRPYIHTRFVIPINEADAEAAKKLKDAGYTGIRLEEYDEDLHQFLLKDLKFGYTPKYIAYIDGIVEGLTDASMFTNSKGKVNTSAEARVTLEAVANNMNTPIDFTSVNTYLKIMNNGQ